MLFVKKHTDFKLHSNGVTRVIHVAPSSSEKQMTPRSPTAHINDPTWHTSFKLASLAIADVRGMAAEKKAMAGESNSISSIVGALELPFNDTRPVGDDVA
jgi:hypothetical protein